MVVRKLKYFFHLQVKQMKDEIFLSQAKYAKNLVKKFGLESSIYVTTPLSTSIKFHEHGKAADENLHRSIIWSLLYLMAKISNLCFSVGLCTS